MSRDDRFALGVLLILALSIPFFLLHRWSQREDTYSAVGAKPLDSAKSILINPVPGADASRAQAPSRLPSLTLPDAPPGAPAQSASDSAPVSAAVEEPPSAPEDAAYGSPVSGAPRPSLAASRSGLSDPGGGGGAAAGGGEEQQASSGGKRELRSAGGHASVSAGKAGADGRGGVKGAHAESGKGAGSLPSDSRGRLAWGSNETDASTFGGGPSANAASGSGRKGQSGEAPAVSPAEIKSMMDTLNKGSKLADKQMAMIRDLRASEDKQFEKIMDTAVKNPPKKPPPDSQATMKRGTVWPVGGRISQNFGGVSWAAYAGRTWNGTYYPHFHNGLDIAAPFGTPIKAYDGGQVNFVGMSNGYGMNVVLSHPGGLSSRYGHMQTGKNAPPVKNGQYIDAGQTVGFIGMTGFTTGPHLHFIVRDAKDYLSPLSVLPKGK